MKTFGKIRLNEMVRFHYNHHQLKTIRNWLFTRKISQAHKHNVCACGVCVRSLTLHLIQEPEKLTAYEIVDTPFERFSILEGHVFFLQITFQNVTRSNIVANLLVIPLSCIIVALITTKHLLDTYYIPQPSMIHW